MRILKITALFLMVALTWGTTWLAMRIAAETIPPLFATAMRFMFASPFLLSIAWLTKKPLLFPPGQRLFQVGIAFFYFAIPFSLMIYGESYVSSGLASIIFSNMPVAVLIASFFILHERTNIIQMVGLTTSLIALTSILIEESTINRNSHWQGIVALVSAVILHAIIYTQCKKRSCNVSVITFNALPCFIAGLIMSVTGYLLERPEFSDFSTQSILAIMYLGAFSGVFGILCYFTLQQKVNAFHASLVFLIIPVIAVSLENYTYGYTISTYSIFLIVPLATGIFLTLLSRSDSSTGGERQSY
ncbi:DMT family transporter [Pantoea stewartii]|uniref:DMT family transporter n=1 Tax=Pantoea stewartii TaxID=66269 RepID=UPI0023F96330|nr:DMT family transporter [Pantoea stewartii]MDF7788600.1 DMT family transporter [Pantoea stewartii]